MDAENEIAITVLKIKRLQRNTREKPFRQDSFLQKSIEFTRKAVLPIWFFLYISLETFNYAHRAYYRFQHVILRLDNATRLYHLGRCAMTSLVRIER
jgi:hypothetical protein